MNAQELTRALGGRWHGSYGTGFCPTHDDGRTPGLKITDDDRKDDGIDLHCFAGCDWRDVKDELRERGLLSAVSRSTAPARRRRRQHRSAQSQPIDDDGRRIALARELWRKAVPVPGTPAHAYLRSRGITIEPPPSLRYLAAAKHTPTGLILPALVAGMTRWPERRVEAVQRTFLSVDGSDKARVSQPRMTLGPARGGAVRLAPIGADLALCEGVEDGLSVMQATGTPAWACLGTSGLRAVVLPPLPSASMVTIFADGDEAGEKAARELAERLAGEGRRVSIARPSMGKDFNDTLRAAARSAA